MTKRQEMLPTLHNLELRILAPHKHLNLPLRIRNRVHHVLCAVQPQHRTLYIRQSRVQAVSVSKIDGCHSGSLAPFFADVVVGDFVAPEVADGGGAVFAESDVDEEVGEGVAGAEGRVGGCAPGINCRREVRGCVPTAQLAGLGRFEVEACAERDDAGNLWWM